MTKNKYSILIFIGIFLTVLCGMLNQTFLGIVFDGLGFIITLSIIFALPPMAGLAFDYLIDVIDERVDVDIVISRQQHILIGIVFGVLMGFMQMIFIDFLVSDFGVINDILLSHGIPELVSGTMLWWLYGGISFYVFYITQHKYYQTRADEQTQAQQ